MIAAVLALQIGATAFRDSTARELLHRARDARLRQDSALMSYQAVAHARFSAGATVGRVGRERLLLRRETVTRVKWHRDAGAHAEVIAARMLRPGASVDEATRGVIGTMPQITALPFYPGQETFWIEDGLELDEDELVHPLGEGSEQHYIYGSGDSVTLRLPDGAQVRLRELKVRPRRVSWNVVVGSMWLDVDRGLLVRAAYRFAEPMDVLARAKEAGNNVPRAARMIAQPMRAYVTAMVVEYGLHNGRFWLPRIRTVEGHAQATFLRVPFSIEHSYRFSSVNAFDSLGVILSAAPALERSEGKDLPSSVCDTGATYTLVRQRTKARIPVRTTISCDHRALAKSAELTGSIYARDDDLFDGRAREQLIADALALGAQAQWGSGLKAPTLEYGLPLTRFNRVEGLSLGLRATQQLGAGYVADATLRYGFADREPNLELGLARSNLDRTIRVAGYSGLASSNDWGNPLSFGSSLSALLWGRDDGFYYRASGVDLTGTRDRGAPFTWHLFVEQQRNAAMETSFSFAKLARDIEFQPNIVADRGVWAGGSVRAAHTFGLDPRGWRTFGDLRLEAAGGETSYGRAAVDVTLSHAVGSWTHAPLAALTFSSGYSAGDLAPQHLWFLGGTHTVRGHPAGAASGDAYWFTRLELAHDALKVGRLSLFGDAGWAGPRRAFTDRTIFRLGREDGDPRALSGAGVGYSIFDGLVRLDVAKGIHPNRKWRADLYLESRF